MSFLIYYCSIYESLNFIRYTLLIHISLQMQYYADVAQNEKTCFQRYWGEELIL